VAHTDGHDQGDERQDRLRGLAGRREPPEQAGEQDHVGHTVEHGVHEGARTPDLATVPRHRAVHHVADAAEDQRDARPRPVAAHDEHAADDVAREREPGQLVRTHAGPQQEREDAAVRPREQPLREAARRPLALAWRWHVAHARRLAWALALAIVHPAMAAQPAYGSNETTR
jgi:hypothetical protein